MADLLSYSLRSTFAQEFYQSLTDPNSNDRYYMYYGKPLGWGASVPSAVDTIEEENNAKRNALFYQLILPSDVSLVAPRYNWTSGVVYDKYEDDVALWEESKKYYVLVQNGDDYNVYLCLNNNNGAPSTVSPSGTTVNEFITSDKYVWKFLYALTNEMQKFLTNDYLPVLVLDQIVYNDERALALNVKANASNGSIQTVTVDTAASFTGLINPNLTNSHVVQTYNSSTLTLTVNLQDLNPTNNYYNTNYVMYFDNGSIGTIDTYTVSGNTVTIILCELVGDPISNGTKYSILPKVNVSGSGTGAVVVPKFTNNVLTSVEVIDGGQNYGFAEVFFLISTTAKMSAIIPPSGGHGYDLNNELRPTKILINKEFNYNTIGVDSKYFAAGSRFSQFGIVKNVKNTQNQNISQASVVYDLTLQTQNSQGFFTGLGDAGFSYVNFIGDGVIGFITNQELQNPFDTEYTIKYFTFNNDTGRGVDPAAPYNNPTTESPYKNYFKVGDVIANRNYPYTGWGEAIGVVTSVEIKTTGDVGEPWAPTGGTEVKMKLLRGSLWNVSVNTLREKNVDATGIRPSYQALILTNNDNTKSFTVSGNIFTINPSGTPGPTRYTFFNFIRFKNSTGQGHTSTPLVSPNFFKINDIVIQKNEFAEETYRGRVVAIVEPGMNGYITSGGRENIFPGYTPSTDTRRNTTIILANISGTPNIPTSADWDTADELDLDVPGSGTLLRNKNCFYNVSNSNTLLLLRGVERQAGVSGFNTTNTINTKSYTIDEPTWAEYLTSTHILGNESLSIAEIVTNSLSVDPNNNLRVKLKIKNPSDDYISATLDVNNSVIEGELVTFLKRRIAFTPFAPVFDSYGSPYVFVLNENYNKINTESSLETLAVSNIKKIQIKRVDSTNTGQMDAVIPVPLSGSYLYRASTSTEDSASGLIISKGEPVVFGSDTLIDVYYVEEKGSFELGDDIIIVENPFVRQIIEKGLGATDSTVTLVTNSAPESYTNIFVNKYSGQVLYTQNITPVELTTDTNFNTRILLGF